MMHIDNLSVQALRESKYVAFMRFTLSAIKENGIIGELFAFYVDRFRDSLDNLNRVFMQFDAVFCTKAVQKASAECNRRFRKMRDLVKIAAAYPESEEKALAAGKLMGVIDFHGGTAIPSLSIFAEAAVIGKLVESMERDYRPQVEAIGIGDALAGLKAALKELEERYLERDQCESEIGKQAMKKAQSRMDEDYRLLVSVVNAKKYEDSEGRLDEFIRLMNVEIGRNRTYTGQGQTGALREGGEGEDAAVEHVVTVSFRPVGRPIERIRGKAGSPLVAPANTPGFCWKPQVPPAMPKRNTFFVEVNANFL